MGGGVLTESEVTIQQQIKSETKLIASVPK